MPKRDADKLPDELLPIKNDDKAFHEKWTKGRNMLNMPHPFRGVILGTPNCGKSTTSKNLIIRQDPPFQEVFVIHCDADHTKESTQSCITRYANDCITGNKRAGQCRGNNSQFRPTRDRQGANLKADRLIRAGQEIFVGYSRDYWR